MAKLNKLDSLNYMQASIASIDAKVSTVADSLTVLQSEVREIRDLSASLNLRMESAESRIEELQRRNNSI